MSFICFYACFLYGFYICKLCDSQKHRTRTEKKRKSVCMCVWETEFFENCANAQKCHFEFTCNVHTHMTLTYTIVSFNLDTICIVKWNSGLKATGLAKFVEENDQMLHTQLPHITYVNRKPNLKCTSHQKKCWFWAQNRRCRKHLQETCSLLILYTLTMWGLTLYGVASISRLLKIICLFCKRAL